MKDILQKLLKGEKLTDEERTKVEAFDLEKLQNEAAAAARRKAEGERDAAKTALEELKAKVAEKEAEDKKKGEANLTETQKLMKRIETLEKAKADAEAQSKALQRTQAIEAIRTKAGVKFVDGIDPEITRGAFAKIFDGMDNLDDEEAVKEKVAAFVAANKGLVADESGHGTGGHVTPGKAAARNPWKKDTFNLTEQMELARTNPTEAARQKAEASNNQ